MSRAVDVVPYETLQQPLSPFFLDYLAGRAKVAPFLRPGAIVTGQQAGLFGGPLFVLWKALGTVVVARELEARRGRPVVPVFWVASDDHDFAEVRSATVVDATGALRTLRYDPREEPLGRPAWDITLDETVRAGVRSIELGSSRFPGTVHPRGFERLVRF